MLKESLQEYTADTHFLSKEEFNSLPTKLEDYKDGNPITRNNFISFLAKSFAISRGSPSVQNIFFEWIKERYGFDCLTTLNNLLGEENGPWGFLSDIEKNSF